jgi:hypothetical protein
MLQKEIKSFPAFIGVASPRCQWAGLGSPPENGGHHARATPSMEHGNDPERVLLRRVGNEVVVHAPESQGAGGQVGTPMTDMGGGNQRADSVKDVFADTASRERVVLGDELPDLGDILGGFRVKGKALAFVHCAERW